LSKKGIPAKTKQFSKRESGYMKKPVPPIPNDGLAQPVTGH
jgi:hypothetical protein